MMQSRHNFAHVKTAKLSWHVQNYDIIGSLVLKYEHTEILKDFNYDLINHLGTRSLVPKDQRRKAAGGIIPNKNTATCQNHPVVPTREYNKWTSYNLMKIDKNPNNYPSFSVANY